MKHQKKMYFTFEHCLWFWHQIKEPLFCNKTEIHLDSKKQAILTITYINVIKWETVYFQKSYLIINSLRCPMSTSLSVPTSIYTDLHDFILSPVCNIILVRS